MKLSLDVFLENSFVPIYGITLVVAMVRYPKYFDTSLRYFPILLLYTFLNDLLGDLIYRYDSFSLAFNDLYNDYYFVIYNIYNIVFFLYFLYLFRNYIESRRFRKWIKHAALVFLIVSLINPFFQDFFLEYQYLTFFVGSIFIIICISRYLYEDYKNIKAGLKTMNVLFFIGTGLLIYHICYLPIKAIRYCNGIMGLLENPWLRRIHLILILIMYSLIIIGFLRMKKRLIR
ncbi:hypothetical protein [Pseudozobellia thermophila]|uniref:Uncharacterized protein n=1 Tax=Pseudozobellia thermophila TaxID=192903 RepID=A0A1M6HIN3_9FLAO|nr:hypothetical protein [Pseudozobellia thermophila]SHJ22009.1 hypothetical protein SAMN04488513_10364 [Pseudozobellia thermophila]